MPGHQLLIFSERSAGSRSKLQGFFLVRIARFDVTESPPRLLGFSRMSRAVCFLMGRLEEILTDALTLAAEISARQRDPNHRAQAINCDRPVLSAGARR